MTTKFFFRYGAEVPANQLSMVEVGARGESGYLTRLENCPRCGGRGGSEAWRYTGWTCYKCAGRGKQPMTHRVFTAEKLANLNDIAERKEQKKREVAERLRQQKRKEFIAWAKGKGDLIGGILTEGKKTPHGFFGSLASQIRSWRALSERQLGMAERILAENRKNADLDAASEWVGEIKERIDFEGIVLGVFGSVGYYGHTDIVKLRDLQGNVFTWFATGYTRLNRGDRVGVRGTVKKHDTYKGVKQTVLTRCKINVFEIVSLDDVSQLEEIA